MELHEVEPEKLDDLDVRLSPSNHAILKPLMALACCDKIQAYCLDNKLWRK